MRLFILFAVLAYAYGERVKGTFEKADYAAFKAKYNKGYTSAAEENAHYEAYIKEVNFINECNAKYDSGEFTFWCGINEWSDMTAAERKSRNGYIPRTIPSDAPVRNGDPATAPDSVDWRQKGAVNGIKNQGQCGSCWAFSAICALEGQTAIHGGSLPDASEQQIVSCDPSSQGCNGGWPDKVYNYVGGQGSNGVDTQSSYPYTASDSACDRQKTSDNQNVAATCSRPHSVGSSEGALEEAVGNVGPISICLDAAGAFHSYSGGIFNDASCGHSINHAVACVGYDNGQDFWIVRNSWGTSWGESGYIRMKKRGQNLCGMLSESCYPDL